jgi:hypothetical protein
MAGKGTKAGFGSPMLRLLVPSGTPVIGGVTPGPAGVAFPVAPGDTSPAPLLAGTKFAAAPEPANNLGAWTAPPWNMPNPLRGSAAREEAMGSFPPNKVSIELPRKSVLFFSATTWVVIPVLPAGESLCPSWVK